MRLPRLGFMAGRVSPKVRVEGGALAAIAAIDGVWAIEPRAGAGLRNALERVDLAEHTAEFAAEVGDTVSADGGSLPYVVDEDGTATVHLAGVMTKRPLSWGQNTSTVLMRRAVRQAVADDGVKRIALIVDSPGGQVSGTADLADDIRAVRGQKPIGAYIEDVGCSAAYWAASQADFVYCNRTAQVGSIGTLLVVEDSSKASEADGVSVHVIGSGKYKGAGVDGAPVTDEHVADFRRLTDEINAQFVGSVSLARGVGVEALLGLEARTYVGKEAAKKGLVDRVASVDEFYAALRGMEAVAAVKIGGDKSMDDGMGALCQAAGIASSADLQRLVGEATLGRQYSAQVRADAKAQAVRAYGAEVGLQLQAQCDVLPVEALIAMRDGWRAEADLRYGIESAGAVRKSAPMPLGSTASVAGASYEDVGSWDQLTEEQQAQAERMGITDPALREAFAATVLTSAGRRSAFTKENNV